MLISVPSFGDGIYVVKAIGAKSSSSLKSLTLRETSVISERPMIGDKTTFTTGIRYSTTRTCEAREPISGTPVIAEVKAVG